MNKYLLSKQCLECLNKYETEKNLSEDDFKQICGENYISVINELKGTGKCDFVSNNVLWSISPSNLKLLKIKYKEQSKQKINIMKLISWTIAVISGLIAIISFIIN